MKFLTDPVKRFELIETMLFDKDAGGFVLLERHIERLATSARYFAYVYDEAARAPALCRMPSPARMAACACACCSPRTAS